MSRSLLNRVEEEGPIQWWCGWWRLYQGGDWGELGQLLGGWVAEWGTGPGHWPLPAWVSSPFFLPWVGADIHAFWLQDNLFSVTNGAEELSDRQLVAWPWRAALPLAWGPRLSAGQYLRLEREPGASGKQPGNQGPGCRTWVHPALLRETGQLCTNARWPEPASIPCLLHPSLPARPTAATQAGDNCRARGGEMVSFCLEVKPGTCPPQPLWGP